VPCRGDVDSGCVDRGKYLVYTGFENGIGGYLAVSPGHPLKTMIPQAVRLRSALTLFACATGSLYFGAPRALAETWNLGVGGSYNSAANWNPASIPNAPGANATFNGAATALNPEQTANRTITLDGTKTVGSILLNTDLGAFTNTIQTGTGGPLVFDEAGAGPATITTQGGGTGNTQISVAMSLADSLSVFVNNTAATSAAGSLNLTAAISGSGGFTKNGDGLATFGTGAKTYTGATVLNAGRMRISGAAQPSATSSFTVNAGAQLTPIVTGSTFSFGSSPLTLNGSGPTTGPFAAFPGAIRQDTNLDITIASAILLQTDSLLHVQKQAASATGSLTLMGNISGPGRLSFTAPNSNTDLGTLTLRGTNSYLGGTTINGGRVLLSGPGATLGLGSVEVTSAFSGAAARLTIETGVLDAIANTATLLLAGGSSLGVADDGFVELQSGVNEIVGALSLAGILQPAGTYGAFGSGAMFTNDEFFSGPGMVTVVPEPGTSAVLLAACAALAGLRRRCRSRAS
jgi:fibronectin-binding autotransporter adhesin